MLQAFELFGLKILIVIPEDPTGQPASAEYCAKVKEHYQLRATVVCDPDHQFEVYGTNGLVVMADSGLRIVYKNVGPLLDSIRTRVRIELGLP